jgi:pimeloyl-ACP methyl ester carboxylesterase
MSTFVLVHGAWHGAWAWDRVASRLREAGATVVTPTLSGLGDNGLGAASEAGLKTHVDDVVRALDELGGTAILVGHSYAGLVVREAADRRPERVRQIVLIDGWAGPNGSSLLSLAPTWFGDGIHAAVKNGGDPFVDPGAPPRRLRHRRAGRRPLARGATSPAAAADIHRSTALTGAVDEIPGVGIYYRPEIFPFAELASGLGYELLAF